MSDTQPTDLGPDGDGAVDFNPERCGFTWMPGVDTPLGRRGMNRARCTARIDDVGHGHHWDSQEQDHWIAEVHENITVSFASSALLQTRGDIRVVSVERVDDRAEELRRFARHLLGPLYTAADVESAIRNHLEAERA